MASGTPSRLNLRVRLPQDAVIVYVAGDLDVTTSEQLVQYTVGQIRGYTHTVALDLSGVSTCDTPGVQTFLRILEACAARGATMRLDRCPPHVQRVLDVAGVSSALSGHPTATAPTYRAAHRRDDDR